MPASHRPRGRDGSFHLRLSCAQVEATEKSEEVIFHFKDAPHSARFGRAHLRATKRSAPAAVRPHKRSGANLKRRASVQCVSANPNEVRVRGANVPQPPSFSAFFGTLLNATAYDLIRETLRTPLGGAGEAEPLKPFLDLYFPWAGIFDPRRDPFLISHVLRCCGALLPCRRVSSFLWGTVLM